MPEALDDAALLALLRRTTDEFGFLQPLLDDPSSAAVLLALVRAGARLGGTVQHNADALTIGASSGGQQGTCQVTLARAATGTAGTIPSGYPFTDARGQRLRSQTAVPVAPGELTVAVPVATLRQTELVNTEDDPLVAIAADAPAVLDGAATTLLVAAPGAPGVVATTFQTVTAATPIVGGAADWLSEHGDERGIRRQAHEDEASYRHRVRNLPDVVSPIAVADVVQAAAQRLDLPAFLVLEPFFDGADPDVKALHGLGSFAPPAWDAAGDGTADFFDDGPSGLVLVDRRTATAYFEVRALDYVRDTDLATPYFDADAFFDDPVRGYPDAFVGFPPAVMAKLLGLVADVQAKKGGGVNFDVFLKDPDDLYGQGSTTAGSETLVFTLTPPVGKAWLVVEGDAGYDAPTPGAFVQRLEYTLADASVVNLWSYGGTDTRRLPGAALFVTAIRGYVTSVGAVSVHLVGHFRVHAITL